MTERPTIDHMHNSVSFGGVEISLTPILTDVIAALLKAGDGYFDLDRLHGLVYGTTLDPMADATLRVHLSRANKVLKLIGFRIQNRRGLGWRIVPANADAPPVPYATYAAVVVERDAALAALAASQRATP